MNKKERNVGKCLYGFSLLAWGATIFLTILSLLIDIPRLWCVGSFACVVIQVLLTAPRKEPHAEETRTRFDACLVGVSYVSMGLFLLGLISLFWAGGGPELVDGVRCVVSHGIIKAEGISEGWFAYLSVYEATYFDFVCVCFLTIMLRRVRALYLLDQSKD